MCLLVDEFCRCVFKDVRANCLCATFLSISSKRCVRVCELRARKICHAKVCKQIWRPLRKVKKEIKVGDSWKNRRKLCAEKLLFVSQQCSEGEKEPVNTMCQGSEHEVSWDDGRRIVEIGMLAEGLESCCFCQQPKQLKNVVDEK